MFLIWILDKKNESIWGDPYFPQPKAKTNQVIFLSEFRNINSKLKFKIYLMHKFSKTFKKIEVFNILHHLI